VGEGDRCRSGTGDVEDGEVNQLIDFAEDTYQIFENLSGGDYLSYDGRNAMLRSIYEDQNLSCPNAWWTGSYTGFCRSTTSDDVVAHEWTHAYTDATHDLIYQWQPGALNEAYSDIFGELVDQINGAGTDDPPRFAVRHCTTSSAATRSGRGAGPRVAAVPPAAPLNPPPWSASIVQRSTTGWHRTTAASPVGFEPGRIAFVEFLYARSHRDRVASAEAAAPPAAGQEHDQRRRLRHAGRRARP
jgi:hypothetical protein